ncbi:hypothetical protein [Candidatus Magnetominusculus dajiuhuensis]|uniref:hypothetical protein n=1 Tax=Candidatus Magnetominusculus dajiuhuensis TaxID=3137712 RepID=UPI003B432B36
MNKLMDEQTTYTKQDMVRLINEVGTNLVLKKDKISLETDIQRKQQEIEYKKEYFERVQKKLAELKSVLCNMEDRSREIKNQIAQFKAEKDAAIKELDQILDLEKKAAVLQQRNSDIDTLTERVRALELKINRLTPEYEEKLREKERLDRELTQKEDSYRSLNAEYESLVNRREHLFTKIPSRDRLADKKSEAELYIVETTAMINRAKGELKFLENELPTLRTNADMLRRKKETLTAFIDNLQVRISALTSAESKEDLLSEIENLTAKRDTLTATVDGHKKKLSELTSAVAAAESSIKDEEDFSAHCARLNDGLDEGKAEIEDLDNQLQCMMLDEEADEKLIEVLGPINEYAGSINAILAKLSQEYKTAVEKLALAIVNEIR